MGVKSNLAFFKMLYKLELLACIEYGFNFLIQSIGMMINDIFWVFFWYLLFQKFGTIGSWQFIDMAYLYAILATSFGIAFGFFGQLDGLAKMIEESRLDYYLTLPKMVLFHALVKINYAAIGDLFFGFIMALLVVPLNKLPLFLVLTFTSSLLFISWSVFVNSISFYINGFYNTANSAREFFLTFSHYPFSVYTGMTKFILTFVIPAGMVVGIPVDLLKTFSWNLFFTILIYVGLFFCFSVWFFYTGLKKYESGNVMGMRG